MIWSAQPHRRTERIPTDIRSARAKAPLALLLAASLLATGLSGTPSARAAACADPTSAAGGPPDATPRASAKTTSIGSVIIQIDGDEATPASLPAATPPGATPVAADSAELLAHDLNVVADSLAACLTAGDEEAVTRLAGERYLGQLFGSSVPLSREDYLAIADELRPVPTRIVSLEEVERLSDEQAKATVTQVVGNQLQSAEWTFAKAPPGERQIGGNPWILASERRLAVDAPAGSAAIAVEIRDTSFAIDRTKVAGPDVVLHGNNVAGEDHEMLVIKMASGFTTADFLRASGPDLPAEVTFIGEVPLRAGREQDLVLVDLDPGTYTIVCLFLNADGIPFLADGMEASFTVT